MTNIDIQSVVWPSAGGPQEVTINWINLGNPCTAVFALIQTENGVVYDRQEVPLVSVGASGSITLTAAAPLEGLVEVRSGYTSGYGPDDDVWNDSEVMQYEGGPPLPSPIVTAGIPVAIIFVGLALIGYGLLRKKK